MSNLCLKSGNLCAQSCDVGWYLVTVLLRMVIKLIWILLHFSEDMKYKFFLLLGDKIQILNITHFLLFVKYLFSLTN